jgi:hypothetical protein
MDFIVSLHSLQVVRRNEASLFRSSSDQLSSMKQWISTLFLLLHADEISQSAKSSQHKIWLSCAHMDKRSGPALLLLYYGSRLLRVYFYSRKEYCNYCFKPID